MSESKALPLNSQELHELEAYWENRRAKTNNGYKVTPRLLATIKHLQGVLSQVESGHDSLAGENALLRGRAADALRVCHNAKAFSTVSREGVESALNGDGVLNGWCPVHGDCEKCAYAKIDALAAQVTA